MQIVKYRCCGNIIAASHVKSDFFLKTLEEAKFRGDVIEYVDELQREELFKECTCHDITIDILKRFNWHITKSTNSDIRAFMIRDGISHKMTIDNGYCDQVLKSALYHIYSKDSKIFEGTITNLEDLRTVMRVLDLN